MNALNIPVFNTVASDFNQQLQTRLAFDDSTDAGIQTAVTDIIAAVRARGDAAVVEFSNRFDRINVSSMAELTLTQADLKAAFDGLNDVQKTTLRKIVSAVTVGNTPRRTARCWGRSLHRWIKSVFTCRAARRRIRRRS